MKRKRFSVEAGGRGFELVRGSLPVNRIQQFSQTTQSHSWRGETMLGAVDKNEGVVKQHFCGPVL